MAIQGGTEGDNLDDVMRGQRILTGHPASMQGEGPEGDGEALEEDHPGQPPATDPDPGRFRFRDQPAAEKGYKELLSRTTKAEQELKRLQDERAAAAEADRLAALDGEGEELATADYLEAINAVDSLPDDAPDRAEQAARIWAKAHRKAAKAYMGKPSGAAPVMPPPVDAGATGQPAPAPQHADVKAYVEHRAMTTGGIAPDDLPVFLGFAATAKAVADDGTPLSIDAQADWAIEKTNQYLATKTQPARRPFMPMGRSGMGIPRPAGKASPEGNGTLDAAIERSRRRL